MRWLDFSRLPPLFGIVASAPGVLTPSELDNRAIDQGAFLFPSGKPMGRSNRYHHRRALERLGLIVRTERRYYPNLEADERDIMLAGTDRSTLTDDQRILLANRVIRHDDCYSVFWSSFVSDVRPRSVAEFVEIAQPILLQVEEPPDRPDRYSSAILLHSNAHRGSAVRREGYTAVQAIHFGMRIWGIEQLRFLAARLRIA